MGILGTLRIESLLCARPPSVRIAQGVLEFEFIQLLEDSIHFLVSFQLQRYLGVFHLVYILNLLEE